MSENVKLAIWIGFIVWDLCIILKDSKRDYED